jgi:hypothetical protein
MLMDAAVAAYGLLAELADEILARLLELNQARESVQGGSVAWGVR